MTTVLHIERCRVCAQALFPARYRCPHCGAADWASEAAPHGVVEESTVVRHRVGAQGAGDVHLATVRTAAGAFVIARADAPLARGTSVALSIDETNRVWASASGVSHRASH
ncbi:zinc ribbon domain-containing protein [Paraburkholderia tropica]|uniref:zinc ribbon domain-containing protein n=1 Tax=Paraburkholderia tropica TaxID=92647 RepID=UPI002AB60571|nr:zinc ribbon domain-containing protein [Paraburkholderia tropica]